MSGFDLAESPWVRGRTLNQDVVRVGLAELLSQAHRLSDIEAPMPPGYAGLWHILTALTYRVTGLDRQESVTEWRHRRDCWLRHGTFVSTPPELRGRRIPDADTSPVERYFSSVPEGRFFLFGERPFLQDPRLSVESATSGVNKFVLGRPAGKNEATWWTRHHEDNQAAITPEEAAWWLIVQWYYGASGKITAREVNGRRSSDSKAGMLRTTITYFPRGESLFASLVMSLVPPGAAVPTTVARPGDDLCPWERDDLPEPDTPPGPPGGMCALLTAVHTHSMLLVRGTDGNVEDVYRTWAYREPWPELRTENPFVSYERNKGSKRPANPARALWRDLDALLPETAHGESGARVAASSYRPPRFLEEHLHLDDNACGAAGVTAVGFHQASKTVDYTWWLSVAPPQFTRLLHEDEHIAAAVHWLLTLLDKECAQLKASLHKAWRDGVRGSPDEKLNHAWSTHGEVHFWERAEKVFYDRLATDRDVTGADETPPQQRDRAAARGLTLEVYDEVTGTSAQSRPPSRQEFMLRRAIIKHRPSPIIDRPAKGPDAN